MHTRKIEPVIEQNGETTSLIIKFTENGVSLKYNFDEKDEYDHTTIQSGIEDVEAVISSIKENITLKRCCDRFFDSVSYVAKDIQRRSGRLIITVGDPWDSEITIEILADEIMDDLVHLCDVLRELGTKLSSECSSTHVLDSC